MDENELKQRTGKFALRVMKLVESLPKTLVARTVGSQLVRCATSVGANYRSACRARSRAEFVAKLGIVEEEADESAFWTEIIIESGLKERELVEPLLQKADEITAIITASRKSAWVHSQSKIENRKSKIEN